MDVGAEVTFDGDGHVHVVDPKLLEVAEKVSGESEVFLARLSEFRQIADSVVHEVTDQSGAINQLKQKAIGARNLVEIEKDSRRRRRAELEDAVRQRQAELERLVQEIESLRRIQGEQEQLIEKLGASD